MFSYLKEPFPSRSATWGEGLGSLCTPRWPNLTSTPRASLETSLRRQARLMALSSYGIPTHSVLCSPNQRGTRPARWIQLPAKTLHGVSQSENCVLVMEWPHGRTTENEKNLRNPLPIFLHPTAETLQEWGEAPALQQDSSAGKLSQNPVAFLLSLVGCLQRSRALFKSHL